MQSREQEAFLRSKYRGAMLGAAIGDALGAPFEGRGEIRSVAEFRGLLDNPGPMRYTDDTHMTLGVAESLLECRGFDGGHMMVTFIRNYRAEPWRGYGASPPYVFELVERGVPMEEAATSLFDGEGSLGNGAAMRVAPVALFAFPDEVTVDELARRTAELTHRHPLGVEGASLQARALAVLLAKDPAEPWNTVAFIGHLKERTTRPEYGELLETIATLPLTSDLETVAWKLGRGVEAHRSVGTALFLFLRNRRSFVDTVLEAIAIGGDTDTLASLSGALSGSYLGEKAIPELWKESLEGVDTILCLADQLFLYNRRSQIPHFSNP
jgi:poly(ADP-ribose) glycohydrolase ARH3